MRITGQWMVASDGYSSSWEPRAFDITLSPTLIVAAVILFGCLAGYVIGQVMFRDRI